VVSALVTAVLALVAGLVGGFYLAPCKARWCPRCESLTTATIPERKEACDA
jgi:hypothetical protein